METASVKNLLLQRQCLDTPAQTPLKYEKLFRMMQPVAPVYFSCPGDAPSLVHRAGFDDKAYNDRLRSGRVIVKGRFQGGTIGYVYADELELYIAAYKKEIRDMTPQQSRILDILYSTGPLTPRQLKEESGMLNKEIMPVLHKLQEAFIVYEDQIDSDCERGWYVFEREWEDIDTNRYAREEAIAQLLLRFLYLNVFGTIEGMKGWLRLPLKGIKDSMKLLESRGAVAPVQVGGAEGWIRAEDMAMLSGDGGVSVKPCVFVMHKADFLVKSNEYILKEKFKGLEVLQYILMDGEFAGAVTGHWRQGPHDVEDIVLTLPCGECEERKDEVLSAVYLFYNPPFSNIRRYNGKAI